MPWVLPPPPPWSSSSPYSIISGQMWFIGEPDRCPVTAARSGDEGSAVGSVEELQTVFLTSSLALCFLQFLSWRFLNAILCRYQTMRVVEICKPHKESHWIDKAHVFVSTHIPAFEQLPQSDLQFQIFVCHSLASLAAIIPKPTTNDVIMMSTSLMISCGASSVQGSRLSLRLWIFWVVYTLHNLLCIFKSPIFNFCVLGSDLWKLKCCYSFILNAHNDWYQ